MMCQMSFECDLTQKHLLFFVETLQKTKNSNEKIFWKTINVCFVRWFLFCVNFAYILMEDMLRVLPARSE